jgi:hypothetical protein
VIRVARNLEMPISVVTEKTSILAKSGAGKSNTAKVIVEGVLGYKAQVIILDPVGHWWGLRSLFSIPVIGGLMGDVPLDPLAGKLMARVAVESGQSMVLDVSLFDSDGEMQRFAYEFAEEFYKLKQAHPTAVLLVLEEADEFAPQDTRGANVPRMVGAFNRIAKRGRGRGIGMLNVTLRSAALSKNVLNQSDTLVVMRTTAPLDIAAVQEWVKYHRVEGAEEVIPSLSGLETGTAWFWTPERKVLQRVKVTKARSLDTSATPEVGAAAVETKALKPIDLESLGARIEEYAAKAKADDPEALRVLLRERDRRIHDLETSHSSLKLRLEQEEAAHGETIAQLGDAQTRDPVEVPVLSAADLLELTTTVNLLCNASAPVVEALNKIVEGNRHDVPTRTLLPPRPAPAPPPPSPAPPPPREDPPVPIQPIHSGDLQLKAGARRILEVLAQHHPMRMTRAQIATLAKLKKTGGTFGTYWSAVKTTGLIEEAADGLTAITQPGLDYIGVVPGDPMTPEELLAMWRDRLKAGARSMLDELVRERGEWVTRVDLAERVGLEATGGTFGTYLSTLKRAGLADVDGSSVRANDVLFLGVRAAA